jgi:hypothetical protein
LQHLSRLTEGKAKIQLLQHGPKYQLVTGASLAGRETHEKTDNEKDDQRHNYAKGLGRVYLHISSAKSDRGQNLLSN